MTYCEIWETRQFDVSSAYLNGNLGGTEIYMRLPGGDIVRLQRALYGLVQAGRKWYKVFTEWILSIGFTRTDSDHAVFVRKEGDRRSFLSIHVDNAQGFEARSTDEASFFLGQSIRREGKTGAAIVNQGHFVDAILEEHHMAERHEIALEPHWFRVQTERIKRCNSQAKKDY
ncbi:BQ5605_C001g00263 [Microbotryum silenes-dioicae]|uniref:BQ5605_C001g00263 protein n=1 Tax=Microbotryum silenes-dioicae TaxID=796604 RepID=A0A2X0M2S3_9BASI|nr:BQ5605_C001g00263 [Microbotryum silenes-dioicae]